MVEQKYLQRADLTRDPSSWLRQARVAALPLLAASPSLSSSQPRCLLPTIVVKLVILSSTAAPPHCQPAAAPPPQPPLQPPPPIPPAKPPTLTLTLGAATLPLAPPPASTAAATSPTPRPRVRRLDGHPPFARRGRALALPRAPSHGRVSDFQILLFMFPDHIFVEIESIS
jgi:hypothetical protein